jgi:hypothetical protein
VSTEANPEQREAAFRCMWPDSHESQAKAWGAGTLTLDAHHHELITRIGDALAEAALSPTTYKQAMEDGADYCDGCGAVVEEEPHTHADCYQQGRSDGALDENIECSTKLAEHIGSNLHGYFSETLARVPVNGRLPGTLRDALLTSCSAVYERSKKPRHQRAIVGLKASVVLAMPHDEAQNLLTHLGMVGLASGILRVAIDGDEHRCRSDDGVTCVVCQRDMSEVTNGG